MTPEQGCVKGGLSKDNFLSERDLKNASAGLQSGVTETLSGISIPDIRCVMLQPSVV